DIGKDGADDDIETRRLVLAHTDPFFDDGGLQVELHPRGDRRADDADGHVDICLVRPYAPWGQLHRLDDGEVPVWPTEHTGNDVSDVEDTGDKEDLFNALIVPLDHE